MSKRLAERRRQDWKVPACKQALQPTCRGFRPPSSPQEASSTHYPAGSEFPTPNEDHWLDSHRAEHAVRPRFAVGLCLITNTVSATHISSRWMDGVLSCQCFSFASQAHVKLGPTSLRRWLYISSSFNFAASSSGVSVSLNSISAIAASASLSHSGSNSKRLACQPTRTTPQQPVGSAVQRSCENLCIDQLINTSNGCAG
jgi:hypothetical protein